VLQVYAVDLALRSDGKVNVDNYLDTLLEQMKFLEEETKSKKTNEGYSMDSVISCFNNLFFKILKDWSNDVYFYTKKKQNKSLSS